MTTHFHKTLDLIGSNFISHAEPGYQTFDEVPPTPWIQTAYEIRNCVHYVLHIKPTRYNQIYWWKYIWNLESLVCSIPHSEVFGMCHVVCKDIPTDHSFWPYGMLFQNHRKLQFMIFEGQKWLNHGIKINQMCLVHGVILHSLWSPILWSMAPHTTHSCIIFFWYRCIFVHLTINMWKYMLIIWTGLLICVSSYYVYITGKVWSIFCSHTLHDKCIS